MKTIEEKAKAYDEALERAKELLEVGLKDTRDKRVVLSFFPELAESEDERIRKEIIATIHLYYGEPLEDEAKEMIAWIEKQKEMNTNTHLPSFDEAQGTPIVKQGEKKPAEWTFEAKGWDKEQIQKCISWLQSLRPQNKWKPSNEQIKALEAMLTVSPQSPAITSALIELYQQLKKLREE